MAFKVLVCAKQVPNTNEIKINPETGTLIRDGVESILNHDDANALEEALALKDKYDDVEVIVVSMGPPQAKDMLLECLAKGADEAILLSDRAVGGSDTWATSNAVTAAIKHYGEFDMIFAGRQAIDGDTAQVGPQIAENLGIPQISYTEELVDVTDKTITVKRQYEDRYHIIEAPLPCLLTAIQELAEPRYMHAGGIIDAYAKDITVWGFEDLSDVITPDHIGLQGSPTKVVTSFGKMPKGAGTKLEVTPDEAVEAIIAKMEERHII